MRQGLSADTLLAAYASGVFPMAEHEDDPDLFWVDPRQRGVLPLDGFHISRSLARTLRRGIFSVTFDTDFAGVVAGCADRDETWINATLRGLYAELAARGHAHSCEVHDETGALVGGVFGVAIGGAFFGESMFSRRTDASKVALAYLVDRLRAGGFTLFDTQFITPHLRRLGGLEIPRAAYRQKLATALETRARFDHGTPAPRRGQEVVQRNAQTS
ncbi:leucyl/phenylalanyl-tRNA--protein transferase [Salibaculum sp.]|uniref:leucyl/phenylalanyl-tRNA--protein transferase n=1 Tax=Salibaculum sp. TaxID=2855480 RepID=UPI002B48876D|nr:leucyl/phenylalanyl-tRNA--protein transferase [Salibaculum sp.]HKL68276.1 leucyl/phenylalanyl-tRNA--protein transferase [Salibaculum sp.]